MKLHTPLVQQGAALAHPWQLKRDGGASSGYATMRWSETATGAPRRRDRDGNMQVN